MSAQETRAEQLARLAARTDWSKVTDAYTGERYGPDVLAELWATDRITADDTCTNLRFAAIGDGSSVSGAAAEILPFLVEAARDPDVTVRFEVLRTIADIAGTGNTAPTAKVDRILEGRWRPTVDARWPATWERAAEELLPLLDDSDSLIRAGAVRALAQSAAHADWLIADFRARFDVEAGLWSAGRLVLGVGELARHGTGRREEALAWLRHRMTVEGKGAEPDIDQDLDAWIAWDEEIRHDVRLQAVEALCRALPGHADPLYAHVTTAALLASSAASAYPPAECFSSRIDDITEADRRLGADLPGRLALAHALLRHDRRDERAGGLRIAAALISRWRSAVPALLPTVAERVSDAHPENRVFALRVLAMCGAAAHPWADLVAARLCPAEEPNEPTREHAAWALSRMGDERCVPYLVELLRTRGDFAHRPTGSIDRRWSRSDLSLAEALAPFAAHSDVLLASLPEDLAAGEQIPHDHRSDAMAVVRRLCRLPADPAQMAPHLRALLDADERPVRHDDWRSVRDDEALCAAARAVLDAV
ncbi:HEAT repeat domain-containing protein [Streptomyces sp. OR43]|uniref:HEAT repeat domain-containing protein n=1 Tax=Streptomyces sp. or43 TaxID=2478957 RepID=UPI001C9BD1C5|nr:HEAT repeat domain-containing protein [Streptomyces sp. or43]